MSDEPIQKENFTTDKLTPKQIIEVFSYDAEEREVFPYLDRYMTLVGKKLVEIENDEEKLKRFALAGLFLTYRAFNHTEQPMETENLSDFDSSSLHILRLIIFRDYFKTQIKSSTHYLKMLNLSVFDYVLVVFRLKSISRKLYRFVIK